MLSTITPFEKFPSEAQIIGRLLASYTALETSLLNCVVAVTSDFDTALKAMFRARGETVRIRTADAFGRHVYARRGLETEFSMGIGAMRCCLGIRNQLAHSRFWDDGTGKLALANLELIADSNAHQDGFGGLTPVHIDVTTLKAQFEWFDYTDDWLRWLSHEARKRDGIISTHPYPKPRQILEPPLHILESQ